jgi:hypothetical protein
MKTLRIIKEIIIILIYNVIMGSIIEVVNINTNIIPRAIPLIMGILLGFYVTIKIKIILEE